MFRDLVHGWDGEDLCQCQGIGLLSYNNLHSVTAVCLPLESAFVILDVFVTAVIIISL